LRKKKYLYKMSHRTISHIAFGEVTALSEKLDKLLLSLCSVKKIETLKLLNEGKKPSEIANSLKMSMGGLHRYLKAFLETELIVKTDGGYQITPLGIKILEKMEETINYIKKELDEYETRKIKPASLSILKEVIKKRAFKAQTIEKLKEILVEMERETKEI